jgi:hypothetical protein
MMPIDTKPEEKIIYGAELEAAVTDGIQRAIGRRIGTLRLTINGKPSEHRALDDISISVDVVGSLKGPKPGAKRKPRAKPATPAT